MRRIKWSCCAHGVEKEDRYPLCYAQCNICQAKMRRSNLNRAAAAYPAHDRERNFVVATLLFRGGTNAARTTVGAAFVVVEEKRIHHEGHLKVEDAQKYTENLLYITLGKNASGDK